MSRLCSIVSLQTLHYSEQASHGLTALRVGMICSLGQAKPSVLACKVASVASLFKVCNSIRFELTLKHGYLRSVYTIAYQCP